MYKRQLKYLKHIKASRVDDGLTAHNTGVYLHKVPVDPVTGLCSLPYEQADEKGYFKIDFLNVSVYKGVRDEEHLIQLMETEPLWDLLLDDEFVNNLFHVNGHGNILRKMEPKSIEQLAAVLAMIRPAKRYLIGKEWTTVMKEIWTITDTDAGYSFKKSHAIAYAHAIVVQLNVLCEQAEQIDA